MGDKSPIILTGRKKRRMAAKAKEEMKARFQWAIDSEQSVDAVDLHSIEFWRPKKEEQVAQIGVRGGG